MTNDRRGLWYRAALLSGFAFCGAGGPGSTDTIWWRVNEDGSCRSSDMSRLYVITCSANQTISDDGKACVSHEIRNGESHDK